MKYETGIEFGGRYTLGSRIAIGGMGEVWRAEDKVLGRRVAIKLLSPNLAAQSGFAQRFREEARNSAALGHPNIAGVYDYGEDSGAHWLVMELVEGDNLAQIIKKEGHVDPKRAANIMAQAAMGLQAAHDGGVIHRDVKPANIIVRPDGVVKLTDFGISRATDAIPITRTGEVMGTAQYISPEQATGQPVSPASDIYSLGVVGYEMVAGYRPFDESTAVATAMAHVQDTPPPLPRYVPDNLKTVIMACLNKDPEDRPATAGDLSRMLTGAPGGADLLATQKITSPQATRVMSTPTSPPTAPQSRIDFAEDEARKTGIPAWVWALLAAFVAGVLIWAASASGIFDDEPAPAPTSSETTSDEVVVDESAYLGRDAATVAAELTALGLEVSTTDVDDDAPAGTVVALSDSGTLNRGDRVELEVSRGPAPASEPAPQEPAPEPTQAPEQTQAPTQEPAPEPTQAPQQTQAPTQAPAPEPTQAPQQPQEPQPQEPEPQEPAPQEPAPEPTQEPQQPAPEPTQPDAPEGGLTNLPGGADPGATPADSAPQSTPDPPRGENGSQGDSARADPAVLAVDDGTGQSR